MTVDWFGKLDDIIQKNSAEQIQFLQALVRAKSANPYTSENSSPTADIEREVAFLLRDRLREIGLTPELVGASPERPNVVARIDGAASASRSLVLNGHMDTVMPSRLWRIDPFAGVVQGNRLYGLGVFDMKASLAMFVYAAKALLECGVRLAGDLILTFVVDEEPGGCSPFGTQYLLENGLTATAAIVAEPGNDNVTIGHRGGFRFKLTVRGEAAHTGSREWEMRERGKNAIAGMAEVVREMAGIEIPYRHTPAFPDRQSVLTFPTLIEGGTSINAVPDQCFAYGDARLMPGNTEQIVEDLIRARIERVPDLDYTLEKLLYVPAVEISEQEEIVQILRQRTTEITGVNPTMLGCGPWNDGWMFITRGIPAVCGFGPAGDGAHAPDEFVYLDSFIDVTRIYVRAIIDYLGIAG
ncbi:MAG: M20/M25/M40 family metallo-hydrolase [Anaerolineae bacterium]|nr:M20/M25/M40 family metallo-hydrolase [Anaerolineae bacterium]